MNMNLDDPKLTAYALDELSGTEKAEMEAAVAASPEAQEFVRELQLLSGDLRAEYTAERESHSILQTTVLPLEQADEPWSISRRLALAAALALFAVIGVVAIGTLKRGGLAAWSNGERYAGGPGTKDIEEFGRGVVEGFESPLPSADQDLAPPPPAAPRHVVRGDAAAQSRARRPLGRAVVEPVPAAKTAPFSSGSGVLGNFARGGQPPQDFNTARYGLIEENPFFAVTENPLSTFSIDVDTAAYANVRRFLESGSFPPKDAVRIEEMINYFSYDYPRPNDGMPFSVNLDAASCPWAPTHRLVRIGLKGREVPNEKRSASNLVFLLDVSGSMMPPNRLPLVKQAMRLLVEKLGENDRVAIVVYSGASGLALPSTSGDHREQILTALENLEAGGSTNGAEGIELAYQTATEHFIKGGVNRVIIATDGDFNMGTTSEGDLVRLIQEKAKGGVFLSVLGVGDDNLNDSMMQKLADQGNGNYAYLDSIEEARKVLVQQINGTLVTIAKDAKIQVEFNPAQVASYRLIGYEKRILRKEEFNDDKIDAGEIGAGHTVTALYEVVPVGAEPNPAGKVPAVDRLKYQEEKTQKDAVLDPASRGTRQMQELLTVKLRYKEPDGGTSKLFERAFVDRGGQFANAATDLKFAAAVAEFGMILRDSKFKGTGTLDAVAEWADEGKGMDANGYRAGFLALVRKAQDLKARM